MSVGAASGIGAGVFSAVKKIAQEPIRLMEKTFEESAKVAQATAANTSAITGRGGKINKVA